VREGRIDNFTGIDSPYEAPLNPEFVIDTSTGDNGELVDQLLMLQLQTNAERLFYQPFAESRSSSR
jgi:adenylylsulfate kinase-like enzyme